MAFARGENSICERNSADRTKFYSDPKGSDEGCAGSHRMMELGLNTVRDVLNATESKLKEANYIGDVRARRMRNAAVAAILEYLSG